MHATGAIVGTAAVIGRAHAILKARGPERAVRFLESVERHPNRYATDEPVSGPHNQPECAPPAAGQ